MSSEEVLEKVKGIIVEQLGVAENSVTLEASFIDDLGADSLDIVELVMALEEEFDIDEAHKELQRFKDILKDIPDPGEANEILKNNIKRANHLLDLAEGMLEEGAMSPRIFEISAKLIDCITTASNSLISAEFQGSTLDLKEKSLEIKKLEIENRGSSKDQNSMIQQNNIITVGSREDILDKLFNLKSPLKESDKEDVIDISDD